ncbi:MAG: alpha/beta hydrolase [Acidimicrobiia bacterium]|nr:alpha/beta hydrolase [Acidimicrobiia bacterium]
MGLRRSTGVVSLLVVLVAACSSSADPTTAAPPSAPVTTTVSPSTTTTASPPTTTTTSTTTTTTVAGPPSLPYFEPGDCVTGAAERLADDPGFDIECGHLVVLEDRTEPDGDLVRLPVMIARSPSPNPAPDPVIYLAGGGGHNHLRYSDYLMESVGDAVLENRDFIQYNQRGAPLTDPELSCPGLTSFLFGLAAEPLTQQEWADRHLAFLAGCRDTLIADGVDLAMYTSAVNAADADDLRRALGYDRANYYGTSYGTRLGLDLIRDYPDGVRSIILDSVYLPQAGFYTESGANLQQAFEYLFAACAAATDCAAEYPDLEAVFYDTIDNLDATPESVEGLLVDGGIFMDAASLYLYSPEGIERVPHAISRAAAGDFGPLAGPISGAITSSDINWIMFYSMQCREEIPFESLDEALAVGASLHPGIARHYIDGFASFHFALCDDWGLEPTDPIESRAVTSEVPALVLAGGYDPVTPPAWGESTAAALESAFYYEFPHSGHGVMRSTDCGLSVGLEFLDSPTRQPDATCIADMAPPDFR